MLSSYRLILASLVFSSMAACGGNETTPEGTPSPPDGGTDASGQSDVDSGADSSLPIGSTVTTVKVRNPSDEQESDVPVTFGQAFRQGDVPSGNTVVARMGQSEVPTQVDIKARHADGSLRHAILTVVVSSMGPGEEQEAELVSAPEGTGSQPIEQEDLLQSEFDASVILTIGSAPYSVTARSLIEAGQLTEWLSGPVVSEWIVAGAPVGAGAPHPHLSVRFSVRAYAGMQRVRVAVSVDNDWAFEPDPQNFVYDASVRMGETEAYQVSGLTHYHHARWRKVFWWGSAVSSEAAQDGRYMMDSGALPHYDPSLVIGEGTLAELQSSWLTLATGPMDIGPMEPYMPATGAHDDIGPLSRWDAIYLCSMDPRARSVSLALADLAGSWSTHYRDKDTGMPVRLDDYPYMSLLGNPGDMVNPETGKSEAFPACAQGADCTSPYAADSAHQPSMGYLAYVVGGDYDHLEEVQFWANYNMIEANPHYRGFEQGLLKWGQVRGQAWSLRTLGFAAYITPDDHPLKAYFVDRVDNNLKYYVDRYTKEMPNALGVFTDGYAFAYNEGRGVAPWQDDFFTWSVGQLAAMGFERAVPLLAFKAKFPVGRMTDPAFCPIQAAAYSMNVRDAKDAPIYDTFEQVFEQSVDPAIRSLPCGGPEMAEALELAEGELTGYSSSPAGYPSNMQPALAVAVESGIPNAVEAWATFEQRPVKPDYTSYPNWAVTPRQ